jgi:hypothetical protein
MNVYSEDEGILSLESSESTHLQTLRHVLIYFKLFFIKSIHIRQDYFILIKNEFSEFKTWAEALSQWIIWL